MLELFVVFMAAIAISFYLSLRKHKIKREFKPILKHIKNHSSEKVPDFNLNQKEEQVKCFEFIINFYCSHTKYFNEDIYHRIARVGHPESPHPDHYTFMLDILNGKEGMTAEELKAYMKSKKIQ